MLRELGRVNANIETAGRVSEFVQAVRFLMLSPRGGAEQLAEKARAPSRVVEFVKSPAAAGSMTGWGSPLASFQNLATAFLQSLNQISAFDALWPSMLQAPLRTTVVAVSSTLMGGPIAEANVKPTSRLSLSASDLDVTKAVSWAAMSIELLRMGSPEALAILQGKLRIEIAKSTNNIFLPILTTSAPSFASSGVTALGVRQDLRVLLANVTSGADSRLFWIVGPTIAKAWSVLPDSAGAGAFPGALTNGGQIGGVPIVVVNEAVDGEIVLVDASQVAAGTEGLVLDSSTQASVNLDAPGDSPVSASTVMTSLWQNNLVAVKAERFIGAKVLRSDAVAKITGATYSGNSPA